VPRVADHELEVVVEVDRGGDVGVVLAELVWHHFAVLLALVERVEELFQHLLLRLLARNHVRVGFRVVLVHDVVHVHEPALVRVQDVEREQHELRPPHAELPAHPREELVVGDGATRVLVEKLEQLLGLFGREVELALLHALLELGELEGAAAVVVHDAELAAQAVDAVGSAALEVHFQALEQRAGGVWHVFRPPHGLFLLGQVLFCAVLHVPARNAAQRRLPEARLGFGCLFRVWVVAPKRERGAPQLRGGVFVRLRARGTSGAPRFGLVHGEAGLDLGRVVHVHAQVVLDHLDRLLPRLRVENQHALVGRVGAPPFPARDVPRVADHELEVVVVVDGRGEVGVVPLELVGVHLPVFFAPVERVEELAEHLRFGFLPREHVRVAVRVVRLRDVVQVEQPAAVLVHHVEREQHHLLAAGVHLPAHAEQELVVRDGAARVLVEKLENGLHLFWFKAELLLFHALCELNFVEVPVAAIVNDAKLAGKACHTGCATPE